MYMLNYSVHLTLFLLSIQVARCADTKKTSDIYYVSGLRNSSTEIDENNDLVRTNIQTETKPLDKPKGAPPAFENDLNDLSSNMVYYERDKDKKEKKQQKVPPILLKSSPVNTSTSSAVGDGLDLAKVNILHQRSSPSVVQSCIGSPVTLKCAAQGNPAPDFTWYKGKKPVDKQKVAEFDLNIAPSSFVRASHLTITPKKKGDFDDYECLANNNLGSSQQSAYKIRLKDKGNDACKVSDEDKQKYHSIVLGTFLSVGMLLAMLFVAGFVFWRLNLKEASEYHSLKESKESESLIQEGTLEAAISNEKEEPLSLKADNAGESIEDDFNAQEIGRLSSLLAAEWERLARLLGFHQHDVDCIRQNSDKIESRCAEMLNKFRRQHGTRETLAEGVEELKDIETANAIRQMYYKFNPTQ